MSRFLKIAIEEAQTIANILNELPCKHLPLISQAVKILNALEDITHLIPGKDDAEKPNADIPKPADTNEKAA